MAQQVITISLNASDFASKVNANFSELFNEFGSGLTRQIVSKDENAGTFISKCNTNFSNLFTAASPSQSRTTLTDNMSANQVVNALNTNFDILFGTESGGGGEVVTDDKLKVLFFGNSYTSNSVSYLPFILQNLDANLKFKISFFFAAGASIDNYNTWWSTQGQPLYTFDSEVNTAWVSASNQIPNRIASGDDWDLIVLQQFSEVSFTQSSYANVGSLIEKIETATAGKNTKIGWNITHPNGKIAFSHPLEMLSVMQSVCQQNGIDVILPYGTAICNALTKAVCREYYGSANNYNRNFKPQDNSHLCPGLPMYIASLAIAQTLSDEFDLGFSIQNDTTTPLYGWTDPNDENFKNISDYTRTHFLPVTDEFRAIAKSAVAAAMTSKFAVTQLGGETMGVTYNTTGCRLEGTIPTTGINFGEAISFTVVPNEGNAVSSVSWARSWGGAVTLAPTGNDVYTMVVVQDLVITATAT